MRGDSHRERGEVVVAARRPKRRSAPAPVVSPDPALLGTDLEGWAGARVARTGRKYALMSRVESLHLSADGTVLEARVRGSRPTPYRVEVTARGRFLLGRCTCPFDYGPACKHAVAAVEALRFPRTAVRARRGPGRRAAPRRVGATGWALAREDRVAAARDQEIDDRRARARKERAAVRVVRNAGGPPMFEVSRRGNEPPCAVVLRGDRLQQGSCTCPDFLKSELETCKHIERARAWYRRAKKPAQRRTISLWWRPREWPARGPFPLLEIRLDAPLVKLPESLRVQFGDDGYLREPTEGADPVAWASQAVAAARDAARVLRARFDLDPQAVERLEEARQAQDLRARLAGLGPGSAEWETIVPGLGMRLHPYQEDGTRFLAVCGRAMLADDMGLGKTVQAIVAALLLRRGAGVARALVVCPASIKHQWRQEIAKACGERAMVGDEGPDERLDLYRRWREGFLVLNYELVLRDLEAIRAARPDLVILDEAQRIKNWDTKTARAVKRLDSPFAFVLTGTPLENRLSELHSLVEFLHPRALGPRWRLLPFHARTDPGGRVLAYEDLDVLRARLRPFFLRRERSEVLDQLPERTDNTFWTGMTSVQWRPYRRHAARIASILAQRRALRPGEVRLVLQSLTSMRILCNAHAQYAWNRSESRLNDGSLPSPSDIRALHSPKLEEFVRVLEDLLEDAGVKVVVFSQWERMLRLAHFAARGLLARRGERADVFHGGLGSRERMALLESFHADPDLRVLFSTDAGGLGLNLQEAASVVVHLEVPWNPAVLEQRVGRVHRLGQRRSVQVVHFVTSGAIEERVRQVVEAKRALFDGLLVDEFDQVVLAAGEGATFVEHLRDIFEP